VRLAEARITLESPVADPTTVFNRPTALVRHFPRLQKDKRDAPAVHELALSLTETLQMVDLWIGDADLSIFKAAGEEMHSLAPLRVGSGFRFSIAYSITDTRIVEDFVP
jgi:acetoacetate decarboxylase